MPVICRADKQLFPKLVLCRIEISEGGGLTRFFAFVLACGLLLCCGLAHAQHIDFAVGGSSVWSPANKTALVGFIPPPIKGGVYPSASLQYIGPSNFGINVEGAVRYHKTLYNDFQPYRPIFYEVNAVFAPQINKRFSADFMGGVGGETVLFYSQVNPCTALANGCRTFINTTHFLVHLGGDFRYYFLGNFFVRPEAHWDFIPNNSEFHSRNVFRFGASVGYTFGSR